MPWRRAWQPTPVFLSGESYGLRSLVGYSPWGCKESDTTKWLTLFTLSLSKRLYLPLKLSIFLYLLLFLLQMQTSIHPSKPNLNISFPQKSSLISCSLIPFNKLSLSAYCIDVTSPAPKDSMVSKTPCPSSAHIVEAGLMCRTLKCNSSCRKCYEWTMHRALKQGASGPVLEVREDFLRQS